MNQRNTLTLILGALLLGGFFYGVVRLFQFRFERGDIYPPYSSLRADPLGAKVMHDALDRIPEIQVARQIRGLSKISEPSKTTVLWLGEIRQASWPDEVLEFVRRGGRLVVAFKPVVSRFDWGSERNEEAKENNSENEAPDDSNSGQTDEDDDEKGSQKNDAKERGRWRRALTEDPRSANRSLRSILESDLGVTLNFEALPVYEGAIGDDSARLDLALPLPDWLSWHSGIVFTKPAPEWRVVYRRDNLPVLIEREYGLGSVVLSSDSYPVSNEALMKEPHPDLLAWMIGGNRTVRFDETHLGVASAPGIMTLARQYRLHGLFAGLLLLAALFLWKSSVTFLPRRTPEGAASGVVQGQDSTGGFINLLRRHIPKTDLLKLCYREWEKSIGRAGSVSERRLRAAESLFERYRTESPKERKPVETYRQIAEVLNRKD